MQSEQRNDYHETTTLGQQTWDTLEVNNLSSYKPAPPGFNVESHTSI